MPLFGKKYKCDACGAKFKSEPELREHAKMHMGSGAGASPPSGQQFSCKSCGMKFNSQAELMDHAKKAHPM